MNQRIVVGISGASGAAYARRLIELLVKAGVETHLVVSPLGQRMLHDELGMEGVDLEALTASVQADRQANDSLLPEQPDSGRGASPPRSRRLIKLHHYRDVGAVIASGSFVHDGMIVIPCSSNTLSAVAHGRAENLLHRAAAVTLKERRRLVLVHREMPISMIEVRNMQLATEAGAMMCPANPGFYMLPKTINDLVDFVVGRVLDLVAVKHDLAVRWGHPGSTGSEQEQARMGV